jgi:hypothetical protein
LATGATLDEALRFGVDPKCRGGIGKSDGETLPSLEFVGEP